MRIHNQQRGFTLIELMVTIAIFAIVASQAVPSFFNLLKNNTLSTNSLSFLGDLRYTRNEARTRQNRVTICVSNANYSNCDNNGDWKDGWIIFVDNDITGDIVALSAGDELLRVGNGLTDVEMTLKPTDDMAYHVSYTRSGVTDPIDNAGIGNGSFVLCDTRQFEDDGAYVRAIVINRVGRVNSFAGTDQRFPAPKSCI
jgi:type IV fimbrial biogenesis protein FimT